jgi:hypothetical protein
MSGGCEWLARVGPRKGIGYETRSVGMYSVGQEGMANREGGEASNEAWVQDNGFVRGSWEAGSVGSSLCEIDSEVWLRGWLTGGAPCPSLKSSTGLPCHQELGPVTACLSRRRQLQVFRAAILNHHNLNTLSTKQTAINGLLDSASSYLNTAPSVKATHHKEVIFSSRGSRPIH